MSSFENIFQAVQKGTVDDVKYFIKEKGVDVNAKNEYGVTPLVYATNAEVVKALVSKGADVNVKNKSGETPLFYAANAEIVKALISGGADANVKDTYGNPPIFRALDTLAGNLIYDKVGALDTAGIIDVIKAFVSMGVDINIEDQFDHTLLRHFKSIKRRDHEGKLDKVIEALVSMGAKEESKADEDDAKASKNAYIEAINEVINMYETKPDFEIEDDY